MGFDSIPARLLRRAAATPLAPAHWVKEEGGWRALSWREYAAEVRAAAKSLLRLGLRPGEAVAILGFNRPEWCVADLACMAAGGAPAGIYTTSTPADVRYVVDHSEARVLFLDGEAQWRRLEAELAGAERLERIVLMRGAQGAGERVLSWERFLELGRDVEDAALDRRLEEAPADGPATLIYTSGTTGRPKGIVLSHRNLAATTDALSDIVPFGPDDVMLSYLPLAHIAEQLFTIHAAASHGVQIRFAQSAEKVMDDLKEVQPTLVFGVPRVWEKIAAGVGARLEALPAAKRRLARWATGVARQAHDLRHRGETPSPLLRTQLALADRLVLRKLRAAIGMSRARACSSGAAPTGREVVDFFAGLGLCILETYGQSEVCGPTTSNSPHRTRHGTVGPAMKGLELRVAADGEILVRGAGVFLGYHKDPAATAEVLVGGWLHSGDLGWLDADGFLTVTGRRKEILVTAGGKNVAPLPIEGALKRTGLLAEAVVVGDRRPFIGALLWLELEAARLVAGRPGATAEELGEDPAVRAAVRQLVERVNAGLSKPEQVRGWAIMARPLTVAQGEVTPTHKVRRAIVGAHFGSEIDRLYAASGEAGATRAV